MAFENKMNSKTKRMVKGHDKKPLLGLFGPTAVGKTPLSFYLAEKLPAGILNCDSISMYKGLDIGSAKPVKEIKQAKQALFLFNAWAPPEVGTAGTFRKKALNVLERELSHWPVLITGGSGFYAQALEKGMYPIKPVDESIKNKVQAIYQKKGTEALYEWLKSKDPKYAKQISCKDTYRILRALCIILSEKKALSLIQSDFQEKTLPFPYLKAGLYLPRETLLKKVKIRTKTMIKAGLLEETQSLLDKGLEKWPLMSSVGYKEAVLCLKNKIAKEDLESHIVRRTMRLAKKQMAWFKRDKDIHWYRSTPASWPKIYDLFKSAIHRDHKPLLRSK